MMQRLWSLCVAAAKVMCPSRPNIAPGDMAAMCNLALAQEWEAAAEIDAQLSDVNHLLFSEANPIPVKWAMAHRGMIEEGIRLPLTPLSEDCRAPLVQAMETYFA